MQNESLNPTANRPLNRNEYVLARWMLEQADAKAQVYIGQLDFAEVLPIRCPCGCATIELSIKGHTRTNAGGIHPLGNFVFEPEDNPNGILSGIEVYGMGGDAPKVLPEPTSLRTA